MHMHSPGVHMTIPYVQCGTRNTCTVTCDPWCDEVEVTALFNLMIKYNHVRAIG